MEKLTKFKIKFFGSKEPREQIKQVKMEIEARDRSEVEDLLRLKLKYKVVNSLKIR